MKRIAAPMIGGIFSSFLLELMVYPVIYEVWKWNFELKGLQQAVFVRNGEGMFERRDVRKFRPVSPLEFEIDRTGNWASLI